MTSPIQLHNTLTRTKEPLRTEHPDRVTMYVCGPTVYNYAHIGHARTAVVFGVLARLLRHHYSEGVYARKFTDVDDKINAAAAAAAVSIGTITARYIDAYHADMRALDVLTPDLEPRAGLPVRRILHCHSLHPGGFDPVPPRPRLRRIVMHADPQAFHV